MKLKLAVILVLFIALVYGESSDSLHVSKVSHQFQVMIGNYVGESFISGNLLIHYYSADGQIISHGNIPSMYGKPTFTPMYSYAVGFSYTAGLTRHLGISTGAGYFTYGYKAQGAYDPCPYGSMPAYPAMEYKLLIFALSLQLPLHLLVYQHSKHGKFVFSAGPDFYLPIYAFGKESYYSVSDPSLNTTSQVHQLSGIDFFRDGSMGFSLGFGYELPLSKKISIEFLPDLRLLNLVPFNFQGQDIYHNYVFNTTFGLRTLSQLHQVGVCSNPILIRWPLLSLKQKF